MGTSSEPPDPGQFLERLRSLEERITRIEKLLLKEPAPSADQEEAASSVSPSEDDEALEFAIGQSWFAKAGIVFLALGIAFLLTFPYQNLPAALPSFVGYLLAGGILLLARQWRESARYISGYLLGGGLALLYFSTLRLYMFGSAPALSSRTIALLLLILVVVLDLVIALRTDSVYLVGLSLALGFLTALLGESHTVFALILVMAVLTTVLAVRRRKNGLMLLGIVLAYFTHLQWAVSNPLLSGTFEFVSSPRSNLVFLLFYAIVFAWGFLYRRGDVKEHTVAIVGNFLNALGCYALYLLLTLPVPVAGAAGWHLLASLILLSLSIAFWVRLESTYATFVYAMLGYMALSTAIVVQFEVPNCFVWLSWQSILVITTAVWFRSRFIIVANFFIYLVVILAYLILSSGLSVASLSFGFVALLSARILNWKKERLTLKTDMMRIAYLGSALFLFPYALYHSVPPRYVSMSWIGVALFYFVMSVYLKNKKYRWMALLTLILTIAYVFLVDLVNLEPLYRIVSFIVLGIVLLGISLLYGKRRGTLASKRPV